MNVEFSKNSQPVGGNKKRHSRFWWACYKSKQNMFANTMDPICLPSAKRAVTVHVGGVFFSGIYSDGCLRCCGGERGWLASQPTEAAHLIPFKLSAGEAHGLYIAAVYAVDWCMQSTSIRTCKNISTCRWYQVGQDDYTSPLWSRHLETTFHFTIPVTIQTNTPNHTISLM